MKFLIVGLGNPGDQYLNTRHNIGFKALDHVEKQANAFFVSDKYGSVCNFKYKGKQVYLLKPNTFMNLLEVLLEKSCKLLKVFYR